VTLLNDGRLVGAMALIDLSERHARGELGYWIGVDYWNLGYCTEAAAAVIRYARDAIHRLG
jgi:RimJ/RimL family protein N-acetyltransferase